MMEGTDLESAYNLITIEPKPRQTASMGPSQYQVVNNQAAQQHQVSAPMGQLVSSMKQGSPPIVHVPNSYTPGVPVTINRQPARIVTHNPVQQAVEANIGYVDSLINTRKSILKLIGLSIVILLAISLHSVIDFALREMVIVQDVGFKQELGMRILYPICVVLLIWSMKSYGK